VSGLLPYMPLWVTSLLDATKAMAPEPRLVYYELLFVHWSEHCVLPDDVEALQRLARLTTWPAKRFRSAWNSLQAGGKTKRPKFVGDHFGLYNPRGRTVYRESIEKVAAAHLGSLKQHGCPECRARGQKVDLGDGWLRLCPRCGVDLWLRFPHLPWLPSLLPPIPTRGRVVVPRSVPRDVEREAYALAVEEAFLTVLSTARTLSPTEGEIILEWYAQGIPLEIVVTAMSEVASRRGRRPQRLAYFRGVVAEQWAAHQKLTAAATPVEPVAAATESVLWSEILERLQARLGVEEVAAWLRPLDVVEETPSSLVLAAPNPSFLHLVMRFREAIALAAGEGVSVRLVVADAETR